MAAPYRPHAPEARAERQIAAAIFRFALDELARRGLPEREREDVAQEVVIAAWQGWARYSSDLGTPRQWLRGIIRRQAAAFVRARRRQPPLVAGAGDDHLLEMLLETRTWEESVSPEDRADSLLAILPTAQRRVVWLHEIAGCTLDEIAEAEGISKSSAHRLLTAGKDTMKAALARDEQKLGAVIPISLAAIFETSRGTDPSPEAVQRMFEHVAAQLDLDDAPDSAPPSSSTRPSAQGRRPVTGRAHLRLVRVLGPIAGVLIGAVFLGPTLPRCDHDLVSERLTITPAAAEVAVPTSAVADTVGASPAVIPAALVIDASPEPIPTLGATAAETAPATRAPATHAHGVAAEGIRAQSAEDARLAGEWNLLEQGRSALASGNAAGALTPLAEHARRFPAGQHAAARERLWAEACTRLRAASHGEAIDARCAARP